MAVRDIVTRGFSNGTYTPSPQPGRISLRGYRSIKTQDELFYRLLIRTSHANTQFIRQSIDFVPHIR